jgi:prepilin-type N-terminal cleavage/methylation domain-containing protein
MNRHEGGARAADEAGFSLIEVMISMAILATGLLSLAGVFAMGLGHLATSSSAMIAREKAREAVESVHTARDSRVIRWCQIYNVGAARDASCNGQPEGVFVTGSQPLRKAGDDGLVNTADDEDAGLEEALHPGPDGLLGTADDIRTPLVGFEREIEISEIITNGVANSNLRRVRVRIRFGRPIEIDGELLPGRVYELTTYVSSIS